MDYSITCTGGQPDWKFSYVKGIFQNERHPTGPAAGFRAETLPNLGILNRSYGLDDNLDASAAKTQWQNLASFLAYLNSHKNGVRYKLLYVARHGEGVHNVKERQIGRHEWERHWARLDGVDNVTWADAKLTDRGIKQAETLRDFWRQSMALSNIVAPEQYFVSPLARCLETARLTFADLPLPKDHPFKPIVTETLREIHGIHTCDRRSPRFWIESAYPNYEIEASLTEGDELWDLDVRETLEAATERAEIFLEHLFQDSDAVYVSVTTHSGFIRALNAAVGHPDVWVGSSAVVPLLVRGERVTHDVEGCKT